MWMAGFPFTLPASREPGILPLNRVLLLQSKDGIGIDIALGALDFERSAIERAKDVEVIDGKFLHLCSPEDLVVMKAFADRALDWQRPKSLAGWRT